MWWRPTKAPSPWRVRLAWAPRSTSGSLLTPPEPAPPSTSAPGNRRLPLLKQRLGTTGEICHDGAPRRGPPMADEQKRSDRPSSSPNRRGQHRRKEDRKLLQHGRELEAARRLSQAFFQCRSLEDLIENVLQTALEVVGAEAGSVLLADYETKRLVFRYVIGEKAEFLHGMSFPWNEGIAGVVFKSGEPAVIADVKQDPRHFTGVDLMTGYKTRDMITLPLKQWEGGPTGVLNVLNKRNGVLNEDDLDLLTIVATFA